MVGRAPGRGAGTRDAAAPQCAPPPGKRENARRGLEYRGNSSVRKESVPPGKKETTMVRRGLEYRGQENGSTEARRVGVPRLD